MINKYNTQNKATESEIRELLDNNNQSKKHKSTSRLENNKIKDKENQNF